MTAQQHGEIDLASVVATRARGLLAERQMKQTELGLAMGITRSRISDRLNGSKDFTLNELPDLAAVLDTSVEYLLGLTDVRESKNPRPGDQDGGDSLAVRHQGLEPRTRWISGRLGTRDARPGLRIVPAPLPPAEQERPAPAAVVDLSAYRRAS